MAAVLPQSRPWWKEGTVYQIWPASFKDSGGDGIGDIQGIISKLPYLKDLGVDIIWLSPMYDSPQIDMGYDISNYEDVYPPYGTLADMDQLIAECHTLGIRLILDLVINHTSNLHPWFVEARHSKDSPKRDWYIWRPPRYVDGVRKPPNNWRANVGGSPWEWDEETQEYYFHLFSAEQPDLNWDSEECRQAIYQSAVKFWLDKGVDGFRVDTVNLYSKNMEFPDVEVSDLRSEYQPAPMHFANGPRMHEFLTELDTQVLSKYDVMTVGELPHTKDPQKILMYVRPDARQLNMVFQFDTVTLGHGKPDKFDLVPYNLVDLKNSLSRQQEIANLGGWATSFLENHDQGRSVSRLGSKNPEFIVRSGKLLATLLITLTGTLFIYQGQEVGMRNMPDEWSIDEYKDIITLNFYNAVKSRYSRGKERDAALAEAMVGVRDVARDHSRTPMQWDDSASSGFTTGKPWTRVHDNYKEINVARQSQESDSLLSFWKQAIQFRRKHADVLIHGFFEIQDLDNLSVVMYTKKTEGKTAVVVLNFSDTPQERPSHTGLDSGLFNLELCNFGSTVDNLLAPWEARVYISK